MASNTSVFGYWIRPDGTINAMDHQQDHGGWLIRNGIFGDWNFKDATDAVDHAVGKGWIGVSYPPVGEHVGIRMPQKDVSLAAAKSLRRVMATDGRLSFPGTSDRGAGSCKELVEAIERGAKEKAVQDVFNKLDAHRSRLKDAVVDVHQTRILTEAMRNGFESDTGVMLEAIESLKSACRKNREWKPGEQTNHTDALTLSTDAVARIRDILSEARFATNRILSGLFGGVALSVPERPSVLDQAFDTPDAEIEALSSARKALGVRDAEIAFTSALQVQDEGIRNAYHVIERIFVTLTLPLRYLKLFEETVAKAVDASSINSAASYYLDHECARTFHVLGSMYANEIEKLVRQIEREDIAKSQRQSKLR